MELLTLYLESLTFSLPPFLINLLLLLSVGGAKYFIGLMKNLFYLFQFNACLIRTSCNEFLTTKVMTVIIIIIMVYRIQNFIHNLL